MTNAFDLLLNIAMEDYDATLAKGAPLVRVIPTLRKSGGSHLSHKYISKRPDGKGGYVYTYRREDGSTYTTGEKPQRAVQQWLDTIRGARARLKAQMAKHPDGGTPEQKARLERLALEEKHAKEHKAAGRSHAPDLEHGEPEKPQPPVAKPKEPEAPKPPPAPAPEKPKEDVEFPAKAVHYAVKSALRTLGSRIEEHSTGPNEVAFSLDPHDRVRIDSYEEDSADREEAEERYEREYIIPMVKRVREKIVAALGAKAGDLKIMVDVGEKGWVDVTIRAKTSGTSTPGTTSGPSGESTKPAPAEPPKAASKRAGAKEIEHPTERSEFSGTEAINSAFIDSLNGLLSRDKITPAAFQETLSHLTKIREHATRANAKLEAAKLASKRLSAIHSTLQRIATSTNQYDADVRSAAEDMAERVRKVAQIIREHHEPKPETPKPPTTANSLGAEHYAIEQAEGKAKTYDEWISIAKRWYDLAVKQEHAGNKEKSAEYEGRGRNARREASDASNKAMITKVRAEKAEKFKAAMPKEMVALHKRVEDAVKDLGEDDTLSGGASYNIVDILPHSMGFGVDVDNYRRAAGAMRERHKALHAIADTMERIADQAEKRKQGAADEEKKRKDWEANATLLDRINTGHGTAMSHAEKLAKEAMESGSGPKMRNLITDLNEASHAASQRAQAHSIHGRTTPESDRNTRLARALKNLANEVEGQARRAESKQKGANTRARKKAQNETTPTEGGDTSKARAGVIRIAASQGSGAHAVEGKVIGNFGVHRDLTWDGASFVPVDKPHRVLTHLPTGMRVGTFDNATKAMRAAKLWAKHANGMLAGVKFADQNAKHDDFRHLGMVAKSIREHVNEKGEEHDDSFEPPHKLSGSAAPSAPSGEGETPSTPEKPAPSGGRNAYNEEPHIQNAHIAKELQGLKKLIGAESVTGGYKGTGTMKHRRQVWIKLADGRSTDVFLDRDRIEIGGVSNTFPRSKIDTKGMSPVEAVKALAERLKGGEIKKAEDSMDEFDYHPSARAHFRQNGADSLSKSLYKFGGYNDRALDLPDQYLAPYLDAFIEEAYEHEAREPEHRDGPMGKGDLCDYWAQYVFPCFVQYIVSNKNLMRAAKKFNVDQKFIAKRLRAIGCCKESMTKPEAGVEKMAGGIATYADLAAYAKPHDEFAADCGPAKPMRKAEPIPETVLLMPEQPLRKSAPQTFGGLVVEGGQQTIAGGALVIDQRASRHPYDDNG